MLPTDNDIELWKIFVSGNRNRTALGHLFSRYYHLLYKYGLKICADAMAVEDAIQELFIDLWQKAPPPPKHSVRAYLLQALRFKLYKHFRTSGKSVDVDGTDETSFELSIEDFIVDNEQEAERIKTVILAINALPARQKEIIYLKLYKGLDYEEISTLMALNYQVVRNLFCQALKTFKKKAEEAI